MVALTKIDRVEPARIAEVEQQIENLLAAGALAGTPIFPVSSIRGDGIDALRAALIDEAARTGARSDSGHFRLAIDRAFSVTGAGVVVTGTAFAGRANRRRTAARPRRQTRARPRPARAEPRNEALPASAWP